MQQSEQDLPLLLGFQGWPHEGWLKGYFPEDLPEDWQFAYYSNESSCLLLPVPDWQALGSNRLEDWCDDAPSHFRFYVHWSDNLDVAAFGDHLGAVLVANKALMLDGLPCLYADGQGNWLDLQDEVKLACVSWHGNLRKLRGHLQTLPASTQAIIFQNGGTPRQLADVRILTELLAMA